MSNSSNNKAFNSQRESYNLVDKNNIINESEEGLDTVSHNESKEEEEEEETKRGNNLYDNIENSNNKEKQGKILILIFIFRFCIYSFKF